MPSIFERQFFRVSRNNRRTHNLGNLNPFLLILIDHADNEIAQIGRTDPHQMVNMLIHFWLIESHIRLLVT